MGALIDLTGQRFGRLVVLNRETPRGTNASWRCKCDCGNEVVVFRQNLRMGNTKSCGCLSREIKSSTMRSMWAKWKECQQ